jgi:hypothetical protein
MMLIVATAWICSSPAAGTVLAADVVDSAVVGLAAGVLLLLADVAGLSLLLVVDAAPQAHNTASIVTSAAARIGLHIMVVSS